MVVALVWVQLSGERARQCSCVETTERLFPGTGTVQRVDCQFPRAVHEPSGTYLWKIQLAEKDVVR